MVLLGTQKYRQSRPTCGVNLPYTYGTFMPKPLTYRTFMPKTQGPSSRCPWLRLFSTSASLST